MEQTSHQHDARLHIPSHQDSADPYPQKYNRTFTTSWRVITMIWAVLLLLFIASCVIIHNHPQPYPVDISTMQTEQAIQYPGWLHSLIVFPSWLEGPLPSMIALGTWFVFMLIMALTCRVGHRSMAGWLQAGIGLVVTVLGASGIHGLVAILVGRPRPDPHHYPIHVYNSIVPFSTYPSGHTEHDIAYYGFLLYLSFSQPVRRWRYRWLLLPLQGFAIYDILFIGYSRILEGDHWFTDVLGGYLEGLVYLLFFLYLYHIVGRFIERHRKQQA